MSIVTNFQLIVMTQQQYINELNDCFKNKSSFYDELSWKTTTTTSPSELIVKLNLLGYKFNQKDFDNFISSATYQKGRSYIANTAYDAVKKENRKKAITIMFTNFTPSDKQFKLLFNCKGHGNNDWVDTLVNRNYIFNNSQQAELIKLGYDTTKIYANKTDVSLDALKIIILSTISNKSPCATLLTIVTNNKIEYPSDFISWIISNLPYNQYNMSAQIKTYKEILNIFLKQLNLKFDENSHIHIYKLKSCEFVYYCVDNGFIPTNESMIICSNNSQFIELLFYFHNKFGLKFNVDLMNNVLKLNIQYIGKEVLQYHYYASNKEFAHVEPMLSNFGYDTLLINQAKFDNYVSIYKFLRLLNCIPNEETFKLGCKYQQKDIVNECTKVFKMLPTNEHLQIMLKENRFNDELLNDILCYKILPTKEDFNVLMNSGRCSQHSIELLIKYGLLLDITDINKALSQKMIIENLERFNISYDETLYYSCYIYNIFPYDDKMEIDKNILELRKMCRNRSTTVEVFKKYIETHNIMPDRYCYDHACFYNIELLDYMIKLNFSPTPTKYYWIGLSKCLFKHTQFINFIGVNKMDKEYMQTKYDIEIDDKKID